MSDTQYSIPPEYQDQLKIRELKDKRSDSEILESLTKFQPVISEKNVWAFWHSGISTMPDWTQRNVVDWIRLLDSSWIVRVLDSVPDSPNHFLKYLPASSLNDAMVEGHMDGPYSGPHSADLLRGACLVAHGGVFMDVGIVLIRDLDRICWNQLADPDSPFQVAIPWQYGIVVANHFVAARKGDPFIARWHKLFVHLWEHRSNHQGLIDHPLVSFVKTSASFEDSRASNYHWEFNVSAHTVFEYITQVVCWLRCCMLEDPNDGFSGVDYWQNHVLIWNALKESWGAEETIGFAGAGQRIFDLLSLRLDSDPEDAAYKEAKKLVFRLLTNSSMQKVVHGKNLTSSVNLGLLWDENAGKSSEPGTFGELLRYGTVHFAQVRDRIEYEKPPAPHETLKKGLLEP